MLNGVKSKILLKIIRYKLFIFSVMLTVGRWMVGLILYIDFGRYREMYCYERGRKSLVVLDLKSEMTRVFTEI